MLVAMADTEPRPTDSVDIGVRMSFGDHLEELRRRILLALVGVAIAIVAAIFFSKEVISILCQPLVLALAMEGLNPRLYQEQVPQLFLAYLQVSMLTGVILASPWVAYQIWKFVGAGLFPHERRWVKLFGPSSLGLFLMGGAFVYFIMLPFGLQFFLTFNRGFQPPSIEFRTPIQQLIYRGQDKPESEAAPGQPALLALPTLSEPPNYAEGMDGVAWIDATTGQLRYYHKGKVKAVPPISDSLVQPWFNLTDYLKFSVVLMFVFGLGFQTPLVIMFLAQTGLVRTATMARRRRVVILILFIAAAVLTPPDVISQIFLALPMWGLFEIGLVLGRRAERKRASG